MHFILGCDSQTPFPGKNHINYSTLGHFEGLNLKPFYRNGPTSTINPSKRQQQQGQGFACSLYFFRNQTFPTRFLLGRKCEKRNRKKNRWGTRFVIPTLYCFLFVKPPGFCLVNQQKHSYTPLYTLEISGFGVLKRSAGLWNIVSFDLLLFRKLRRLQVTSKIQIIKYHG